MTATTTTTTKRVINRKEPDSQSKKATTSVNTFSTYTHTNKIRLRELNTYIPYKTSVLDKILSAMTKTITKKRAINRKEPADPAVTKATTSVNNFSTCSCSRKFIAADTSLGFHFKASLKRRKKSKKKRKNIKNENKKNESD